MADKNPGFTKRLRQSLEDTGLDNVEFAKKIGIGYSTFAAYLNPKNIGKVPEWSQLVKIARGLETTTDWLLTGKQASTPNPSIILMDAKERYPFLKSLITRINRAFREGRSPVAVAGIIQKLAEAELIDLKDSLERDK